MKKVLILSLAILFGCSLSAKKFVPTEADLAKLKTTKTLVVLENNPLLLFNPTIKDAFKSHWDFTEYEFIDTKEFEEKRKDDAYSFVLLTTTKFIRDKVTITYKFLNVLMGGDYANIEEMPEILSFPLAYNSADEGTYIYKLGGIVAIMQNHLKAAEKNPKLLKDKNFKYANKNIKQIKNKEIWITESEIHRPIRKIEKLKEVYPHKIAIKTETEIQKAIAEKNPNVIVMHKVGPEGSKFRGRCYKVVFDASGEKMYYFKNYQIKTKPDAWIDKEFKKFAK